MITRKYKSIEITEEILKDTKNKKEEIIHNLLNNKKYDEIIFKGISLDNSLTINDTYGKITLIGCDIKPDIRFNSKNIIIRNTKLNKIVIDESVFIVVEDSDIEKLYLNKCVCNFYRNYSNIKEIHIYETLFGICGYNDKLYFDEEQTKIIYDSYCNLLPVCPEEGSFIGFKKALARNKEEKIIEVIIKLKILEESLRSSGLSRKCRANLIEVLDIYDINNKYEKYSTAYSMSFNFCEQCQENDYPGDYEFPESCDDCDWNEDKIEYNFKYQVGDTIFIDDFCDNRWEECAPGIHFFITEQEAINY